MVLTITKEHATLNITSKDKLVSHLAGNSIQVSGSLGGDSATTEGK